MGKALFFDPAKEDLLSSASLEASAGTGKTWNLERIVCELIARYAIPLESILVVTYTNKAARELKERIRRLLVQRSHGKTDNPDALERLRKASSVFDRASIYTIHGFCQHVLKTWPFESGAPFVQDFIQDDSLIEEVLRDVLYRALRHIPEEEQDFVRIGLEGADLEKTLKDLVQDYKDSRSDGGIAFYPEDREFGVFLEKFKEEAALFARGQGQLRKALCKLAGLSPDGEQVAGIFKAFKTGQRRSVADKAAQSCNMGQAEGTLVSWLNMFFKEHLQNLAHLAESRLRSKGKNITPKLSGNDQSLVMAVTELFEAIAPYIHPWKEPRKDPESIYDSMLRLAWQRKILNKAIPLIQERKNLTGAMDFDDLIRLVSEGLKAEEKSGKPGLASPGPLASALASQYRVVLVDEFQDTDQRQWDIFRRIFDRKGHNFFLIGDPKQSIYGFRGADLEIYFKACKTVPRERAFSLGTNYRSRKEMVDACNFLFSRLFALKVKGRESLPFGPVNAGKEDPLQPIPGNNKKGLPLAAFQICEIDPDPGPRKILASQDSLKKAWMRRAGEEITYILSGGMLLKENKGGSRSVTPGDIAILMENNRDCETMQTRLEALGIPSVIYSERKVFQSSEALHFASFLRALAEPGNKSALSEFLLCPAFDIGGTEGLQEFLHGNCYESFLIFLKEQAEVCRTGGLLRVFRTFFEEFPGEEHKSWAGDTSWRNRLLKGPKGLRRCTNLMHLAELFHNRQRAKELDARGLWKDFQTLQKDPSNADDTLVRLEQDGQAVQILTLHKSKGLEFPIVFFFGGMSSGRLEGMRRNASSFLYQRDGQRQRDFLLRPGTKEGVELSEWEEKKRLYYVAFTRGETLLYLPWFPRGKLSFLSSLYGALCTDSMDGALADYDLSGGLPLHLSLLPPKISERTGALNKKMGAALNKLTGRYPDLFSFRPWEERRTDWAYQPLKQKPSRLTLPALSGGNIFSERIIKVSSFTSLGRMLEEDTPRDVPSEPEADRDYDGAILKDSGEEENPQLTRGAVFGNLVHLVLEELDYSLTETFLVEGEEGELGQFLKERALRYFDPYWWESFAKPFCQLVYRVLHAPLERIGPLKDIPSKDRKHELEFLLSCPRGARLRALWEKDTPFEEKNLHLEKGYVKGFIDLIFQKKGKYYIADWKTTVPPGNPPPEEYTKEVLETCMLRNHYHLQGFLYAYAFRKYMQSLGNSGDFSWERDFGGIYYFFVRGMGEDPHRGVYFFKPEEKELLKFFGEDI